jgi:hypothetical protein
MHSGDVQGISREALLDEINGHPNLERRHWSQETYVITGRARSSDAFGKSTVSLDNLRA